jgi:hypothetical protein
VQIKKIFRLLSQVSKAKQRQGHPVRVMVSAPKNTIDTHCQHAPALVADEVIAHVVMAVDAEPVVQGTVVVVAPMQAGAPGTPVVARMVLVFTRLSAVLLNPNPNSLHFRQVGRASSRRKAGRTLSITTNVHR